MDGFDGGLITEEVAMGWMAEAVDAASLLLGVQPTLAGVIEIIKGPVAFEDALLQGAAD